MNEDENSYSSDEELDKNNQFHGEKKKRKHKKRKRKSENLTPVEPLVIDKKKKSSSPIEEGQIEDTDESEDNVDYNQNVNEVEFKKQLYTPYNPNIKDEHLVRPMYNSPEKDYYDIHTKNIDSFSSQQDNDYRKPIFNYQRENSYSKSKRDTYARNNSYSSFNKKQVRQGSYGDDKRQFRQDDFNDKTQYKQDQFNDNKLFRKEDYDARKQYRQSSYNDDKIQSRNNLYDDKKSARRDIYNNERNDSPKEIAQQNQGDYYVKKSSKFRDRSYTPNQNLGKKIDTHNRNDSFSNINKKEGFKKEVFKKREEPKRFSPYRRKEIRRDNRDHDDKRSSPNVDDKWNDNYYCRKKDKDVKQPSRSEVKCEEFSPIHDNRSISPIEKSPMYQKAKAIESYDRYEKPASSPINKFDNFEKFKVISPIKDDLDDKHKDKKHKRTKKRHHHDDESPIKKFEDIKDDSHSKRRKRKRFGSPIENDELSLQLQKIKTEIRESRSSRHSKKKSSRWGDSQCMVSQHLRYEDALVYSLQMQLNEVTNKLAQKNYASEYEIMKKLPEPDPVYGPEGKRVNTKEQRARERLENRKLDIMVQLHDLRPDLVTNVEKLISNRVYEKVFIPQEEYPDINFAGLIIGPRGMTQKDLEKETETKIILRGKGSVKVAKMAGTGQSLPGDDEALHAYITSSKRENVLKAAEKIKKIVQDAIEHPELENELRKNQMKQLAIINGTYRETEGLTKLRMRDEINSIVTNTMICSLCGGTGHLPRDCKIGNLSLDPANANFKDPEYKEFLTSIGKTVESYEYEQPEEQQSGVSNFIKNFVFKT